MLPVAQKLLVALWECHSRLLQQFPHPIGCSRSNECRELWTRQHLKKLPFRSSRFQQGSALGHHMQSKRGKRSIFQGRTDEDVGVNNGSHPSFGSTSRWACLMSRSISSSVSPAATTRARCAASRDKFPPRLNRDDHALVGAYPAPLQFRRDFSSGDFNGLWRSGHGSVSSSCNSGKLHPDDLSIAQGMNRRSDAPVTPNPNRSAALVFSRPALCREPPIRDGRWHKA